MAADLDAELTPQPNEVLIPLADDGDGVAHLRRDVLLEICEVGRGDQLGEVRRQAGDHLRELLPGGRGIHGRVGFEVVAANREDGVDEVVVIGQGAHARDGVDISAIDDAQRLAGAGANNRGAVQFQRDGRRDGVLDDGLHVGGVFQ